MLTISNQHEEWVKDYHFDSDFNNSYEEDIRRNGKPIKPMLKPRRTSNESVSDSLGLQEAKILKMVNFNNVNAFTFK